MQKNNLEKSMITFFKKNINQEILKKDLYSEFLNPSESKKSDKKKRNDSDDKKIAIEEFLWLLSSVGLILNDRKSISIGDHLSLSGTISLTRKGDAFVQITKDHEAYIPSQFIESAMTGDLVEIEPIGKGKKDRLECRVVGILKRGRDLFRMRIIELGSGFFQGKLLDMQGLEKIGLLSKKSLLSEISNSIKVDDIIIVKMKENSTPVDDSVEVSFVRVEESKGMDMDLNRILMKYNFIQAHPDYADLELPEQVTEKTVSDWNKRVDLRELYTVTIDGETAKDFDDAISFVEEDKRIRFYVHIADVSYYVKKDSDLDNEAYLRATSVYLANRVVPMLPPELSENLCSLVANVNRLAFTVEMEADYSGKIFSAKFYKSIIKVNDRYTYERAEKEMAEGSSEVWLNKIMKLANAMKKLRIEEGRIELSFKETYVKQDEFDPKKVTIHLRERLNAHILIEELMLSANTKVAEFLRKKKAHALYRVHEVMDDDKLERLNAFLELYGFKEYIKTTEFTEIRKALGAIAGHKSEKIFNYFLLRSFMQAFYGGEPLGHWGLGFKDYCHFTSPIRRYPDLVCHRALENIINNEKSSYDEYEIKEMGFHCSKEERRAADAERDILKLKACRLIESIDAQEFMVTITGIKPHMIFVELDDYYSEAVVSFTEFTNENELKILDDFSFYGKKLSKNFFLGDKLSLRLEKIDFDEIKIFLKF